MSSSLSSSTVSNNYYIKAHGHERIISISDFFYVYFKDNEEKIHRKIKKKSDYSRGFQEN